MSILKVEMYTVVCDRCGQVSGEGQEICAWNEPGFAVNEALDSFDWIEVDPSKIVPNTEKHYCPNCTEWDEEKDERIPKSEAND